MNTTEATDSATSATRYKVNLMSELETSPTGHSRADRTFWLEDRSPQEIKTKGVPRYSQFRPVTDTLPPLFYRWYTTVVPKRVYNIDEGNAEILLGMSDANDNTSVQALVPSLGFRCLCNAQIMYCGGGSLVSANSKPAGERFLTRLTGELSHWTPTDSQWTTSSAMSATSGTIGSVPPESFQSVNYLETYDDSVLSEPCLDPNLVMFTQDTQFRLLEGAVRVATEMDKELDKEEDDFGIVDVSTEEGDCVVLICSVDQIRAHWEVAAEELRRRRSEPQQVAGSNVTDG